MDVLDNYKVNLNDLQAGVAEYRFELDDAFFETVKGTLVNGGHVSVTLHAERERGAYAFTFHIKGVVRVPCDRCLDDMEVAVDSENVLDVKLGEEYVDDGDVIVLPKDSPVFNVAWNIYEFVALAVPGVHVHDEGQCNVEMAKTLAEHMVDSPMEKEESESGGQEIDPRWSELKKIIVDNNIK